MSYLGHSLVDGGLTLQPTEQGNIISRHLQTSGDEIKKIQEYLKRTRKLLRTKLLQESHQMNKHFGSIPCKVLGTIFKMDGGTFINRAEDKKYNDAQRLTFERWHWLYASRKEGRREHVSTDYNVDASIRELEDYIKKEPRKTNYSGL